MEVLPINSLLTITWDDVNFVRKFYECEDVNAINESLSAVEEWMKKQDHLVGASKYASREYLERVFVLSKFSVEATKQKVDKLFTIKNLMPEICLNKTVTEFDRLLDAVSFVPLPKMCPTDHCRVELSRFYPEKLDSFNMTSFIRFISMMAEYRLNYDYCMGDKFIVDLNNINQLSFLAKINPIIVKKADVLCSEGYGSKIKGIHIVNAPPFVDKLVTLLKQSLREKLASRLHVHQSYEDLHKYVPKEILPKDMGGDEASVEKLTELWREEFRTERAWRIISESENLVSDESKRSSSTFNQEYMGMPGSFRKLNVD